MFDELKSISLEAFTKKHDPDWDIPLNESLPQPVIDLPGLAGSGDDCFKLDGSGASAGGGRKLQNRVLISVGRKAANDPVGESRPVQSAQ